MFQFFAGRVKVFAAFWTASALWHFSIRSRGAKAAEDCRSPRRFRGSAPTSAVQAPMLSEKRRGPSMNCRFVLGRTNSNAQHADMPAFAP